MYILGISCWYHDSAAAILKNDEIIAAAQEERFSRLKHDSSFPRSSITYCLNEANITFNQIDKIAFYENPKLKYKRILNTYKSFFPKSIKFFLRSFPKWFFKKRFWKTELIKEFETHFNQNISKNEIYFVEHHLSHAASAFYCSPFEKALALIIDGVGEFDTISIWKCNKKNISKIRSLKFPNSLGLLYSSFTNYLGFKVNSGEYKVMGLAPYGEPIFYQKILNNLIELQDDGMFKLNMNFFNFATHNYMINKRFENLFGQKRRTPESDLTKFHMDIAASIQKVTNFIVVNLAGKIRKDYDFENLCLAGGVALNCVTNGKILKSEIFKKIWIQPAAGDAGGSIGAALSYFYSLKNCVRVVKDGTDKMKGNYLGPSFTNEEVEDFLFKINSDFKKYKKERQLVDKVSDLLKQKKVIGWFQGRMEFGPRSLGNRSILGDPRDQNMQKNMNLKIKFRESFRPFAPSIIYERTSNWFDLNVESPYMLLVSDVKEDRCKQKNEVVNVEGLNKLKVIKSEIPAITHVDFSARIQTVSKKNNHLFHSLIKAFESKTGCPILINTSFNVRGEPIVCSPEEAFNCFISTDMDALVLNNCIVEKDKLQVKSLNLKIQKKFKLD